MHQIISHLSGKLTNIFKVKIAVNSLVLFSLLIYLCIAKVSCSPAFDTPPSVKDTITEANTSIMQLKQLHQKGSFETVETNIVIKGVVTANDNTGNFYKQIVIQDHSGGIAIKLDDRNLHAMFPIGKTVLLKCQGLVLSDYHGLVQIGGGIDKSDLYNPQLSGITHNLFSRYLTVVEDGKNLAPKMLDILQITPKSLDTLQNTLVSFANMEFPTIDTAKTFADISLSVSAVTYQASNCLNQSIAVRTSSYAGFAGVKLPKGQGLLTGILTLYENTPQLIIRDTSDVQFYYERCILFEEDFENCGKGSVLSAVLPGWVTIAESGDILFEGNNVSSNGFAEISGRSLAGNRPSLVSWLISPPIHIDGALFPFLIFETKDGYDNGATFNVYISEDYQSGNPSGANWQKKEAIISNGSTSGYAANFLSSGMINLQEYAGKTIRIGFKYEGASPATGTKRTTAFRLDNVQIRKGN